MRLAMIVPTRGRPGNAVELAKEVNVTFNPRVTTLVFVIDFDDPAREEYCEVLGREAPWAEILPVPSKKHAPRRLGPVLNWAAGLLAPDFDYLGFMGDDHRPRTPLWDERLCRSLGGRPGVAYGDDLLQRQNLPTAWVMSAGLVRVLGYMCPSPLVHFCLDDFVKLLGETLGNLQYCRDVTLEHLHPFAGKALVDATYAESGCNQELLRDDRWRYRQWLEHVWPGEVKRLEKDAVVTDIDISLTFTSRGRPQDLSEALHGLWGLADDPSRLEAIVAVDPDDDATLEAVAADPLILPLGAKLWVAPERYGYNGLHHYLNEIVKKARGKWLMWFNDDMRMQTRGWDTVIRFAPPGVLWPRANHVGHANIAPVWPKAWTDATGYVSPNMHLDTWLQYAADQLGCHYPVPIEIIHDRADVTGNHDDATYREGRFLLGPEGMTPDFHPTLVLLPSWIETVRKVMNGHP